MTSPGRIVGVWVLGCVALWILAVSPNSAEAQQGRRRGNSAQNGWMGDYRAAKAEAERTGKPIMIEFRCGP